MPEYSAVIVAAGEGKRFGGNKVFVEVFGKHLVEYSLDVFENHPDISEIILVLNKKDLAKGDDLKLSLIHI